MAKTNYIKIKNTSRSVLFLDLSMVTPDRIVQMKDGVVATITEDEYNYLETACPKLFENGNIVVVSKPENVETLESKNVASKEDIETLVNKNLTQFKKEIKNITSLDLIKDIRVKAYEIGKNDKFMEVIDEKIKELADGSILI